MLARGTFVRTTPSEFPRSRSSEEGQNQDEEWVGHETVKINVDSVQRAITCDPTNPCDTAVQMATVQPGGSSGWHTTRRDFRRRGPGEGTIYRVVGSDCPGRRSAWDRLCPDAERASHGPEQGTVPFTVYTFYVLPRGTANTAIRIDQPQPAAFPSIH